MKPITKCDNCHREAPTRRWFDRDLCETCAGPQPTPPSSSVCRQCQNDYDKLYLGGLCFSCSMQLTDTPVSSIDAISAAVASLRKDGYAKDPEDASRYWVLSGHIDRIRLQTKHIADLLDTASRERNFDKVSHALAASMELYAMLPPKDGK